MCHTVTVTYLDNYFHYNLIILEWFVLCIYCESLKAHRVHTYRYEERTLHKHVQAGIRNPEMASNSQLIREINLQTGNWTVKVEVVEKASPRTSATCKIFRRLLLEDNKHTLV